MSENGLQKLRDLGDGAGGVGKAKVIKRFNFTMDIRGLAKRLLDNEDYSEGRDGRLY